MNTTTEQRKRQESLSDQLRGISSSIARGYSSTDSITHQDGISDGFPTQTPAKPKRDYFVQVPHMIFDSELPHMTRWGFAEFLRHFGRIGSFDGSIRKLCKILDMARATVTKMIKEWVKAGWVLLGSRAKDYEDGDVMSILILSDCLWVDNHECYTKTEEREEEDTETGTESDQGGSKVYHPGKEMNQSGTHVDQRGSKVSRDGSFLGQTGLPPTLKTDPNIGNIESNIFPNMEGNIGKEYSGASPQTERITEPLPALPPSSSEKKEMTWETILPTTPHASEAILLIATHYLGAAKVSQADADAFIAKTQNTATLTGPHEVRKQLIRNLTFLSFCDHTSNWFAKGDRRKQLTFAKAVAWHDDTTRKANAANWEPPLDKVPGWYHADETLSHQPGNDEDYFRGMSKAEAEVLSDRIEADYPGMQAMWCDVAPGRVIISLSMGRNETGKEDWYDLYKPWEWAARGDDFRFRYVLEAYEQYALVGVA